MFSTYDSILLVVVGMQIIKKKEKYLSPFCFIVKHRYAMEDIST